MTVHQDYHGDIDIDKRKVLTEVCVQIILVIDTIIKIGYSRVHLKVPTMRDINSYNLGTGETGPDTIIKVTQKKTIQNSTLGA